ncbi:GNAT family N-acetyltransferase [Jatrophihabitans sp. DSM 45814]
MSAQPIVVRKRTAQDVPTCVDILRQVHGADGYPLTWPSNPAAWLTPTGQIAAWIAVQAGVVTGHIALVRGAPRGDAKAFAEAEIARLFVSPAARGVGAAAELVDVATQFAHSQGLTTWLEVAEDSLAAVSFYQGRGWRLIESAPASWTTAEGRRPTVLRYLEPAPGR